MRDGELIVGGYLPEVVAVHVVRGRTLHVRFDDGLEGEVDLGPALWGPALEELALDDELFRRVFLEGGTVAWPGDNQWSAESLYDEIATTRAHAGLPVPLH